MPVVISPIAPVTMAESRVHRSFIHGEALMRSAILSRTWELWQGDRLVASVQRLPRHRMSRAQLADGRTWIIAPDGWGVVRVEEDDTVLATARRQGVLGRRWELTGRTFGFELAASSMLRRHWTIGQGGAATTRLDGGILSFNTIAIHADLPVPTEALLAAWQVMVRAWEAASAAIRPALTAEDLPEPSRPTDPSPVPLPWDDDHRHIHESPDR